MMKFRASSLNPSLAAWPNRGDSARDAIAFARRDFEFIPKKVYPHTVRVEGCVVGRVSNKRDVVAGGFKEHELLPDSSIRDVGTAEVYVEHGERGQGVLDVSLAIEDW